MSEKLINWFYGIIASPSRTLREISREKPIVPAIIIFFIITLINFLISFLGDSSLEEALLFLAEEGIIINVSSVFLVLFLVVIVFLLISTLLTHLFARLFKGTGGYTNFLTAYLFIRFLAIFYIPLTFIGSRFGFGGELLMVLGSLGISVWMIVLEIIAIRESYNLMTGTSVGIYFLTLAAMVVIIVVPLLLVLFSTLRYVY